MTLLAGFILLIVGAEMLVRGSSRLAVRFGVPPLVIGLTVVAFGTSSPELAVSLGAAWSGQPDLAVGNVVGSNILNVLLILGLSASIAPLVVAQQLTRFDVPLMVGASFLLLGMAWDGSIGRSDGILLTLLGVGYIVFCIRMSRKETKAVQQEYAEAFSSTTPTGTTSDMVLQAAIAALGLALLYVGAEWLVSGSVALARSWGISELIIGLTILSVGTSMPEIATSAMATLRGERDIAIGNVIGSNLFNILFVLGLTGAVSPGAVPVSAQALEVDIPIMTAVAFACLPVFFIRGCISRWEGAMFLGYYAAYVTYLLLSATGHAALPAFRYAMLLFILPLTVITLAVLAVQTHRKNRRSL